MKDVHLLTGNKDKIKAANRVFNQYDVNVLPLQLDIPEIQASTSSEIAAYMVKAAYELTGKPIIREDHSFFIDELGFPGPFMAYTDKTISAEQLLAIVNTLKSRYAHFELGAAYIDAGGEIHTFSYRVPVVISKEIRGSDSYNWERLMMLPGETKTFAETSSTDREHLWTNNFTEIAKLIHSAE